MAVMLRVVNVPARVAIGYQSGVYNPVSGWLVIRASDAHSWVEAWLPGRGWTTFDPTPPDPNPAADRLGRRLGFYMDAADTFWQEWVLSYNLDRQLILAAQMQDSSRTYGSRWWDRARSTALDWKEAVGGWGRRYGMLTLIAAVLAGAPKPKRPANPSAFGNAAGVAAKLAAPLVLASSRSSSGLKV